VSQCRGLESTLLVDTCR